MTTNTTKLAAALETASKSVAKMTAERDAAAVRLHDGALTRDQMKAKIAKLDAELLRLEGEARASKQTTSPLADPAVRRAALADVANIRRAWSRATPEEKRHIVTRLAEEARIAPGRPVEFVWRSPELLGE